MVPPQPAGLVPPARIGILSKSLTSRSRRSDQTPEVVLVVLARKHLVIAYGVMKMRKPFKPTYLRPRLSGVGLR